MTIKDIAEKSGYAVSTVSRALNGHPDVSPEAQRRIREIVQETGFIPNTNARRLKSQQARVVAIIIKGTRNPFFAEMLAPLQERIGKAGLATVVRYLHEHEDEVALAAQLCRELKPRGILFLGGDARNFAAEFSQVNVPCVLATVSLENLQYSNLSTVAVDDRTAAKRAIEHLLENGHRRILVLGGDTDNIGPSRLRLEGCREAFRSSGLSEDALLYRWCRFNTPDAYRAMCEFLDSGEEASAIFAMSDSLAVGAARALADRKIRIPEDYSIIAFDGTVLSEYYTPRLAAMRQPADEIVLKSADCLLASIWNGAPACHLLLPAQLVAGESVKNRK